MKRMIIVFLIIISYLLGNQVEYGLDLLDSINENKKVEGYSKKTFQYLQDIGEKKLLIGVTSGSSLADYDITEERLDFFRFVSYSIKNYFDFQVKFIFADDYEELEDLLKDRKIDLIIGTSKEADRKLKYKFSVPVINRNIGVFTRGTLENIKKVYIEDEIYWNYKTDEVLRGLIKGIDYEVIQSEKFDYSLLLDSQNALIDGEERLKFVNKLNESDMKFLPFVTKPFYIIFGKNEKSQLVDVFNINLSGILGENIRKYYRYIIQEYRKDYFLNELTQEEKSYLSDNKELNIYVNKHHFPYMFYDNENSVYNGVFIDLMKKFSELTKQNLNLIEVEKEKKIDLFHGLILFTKEKSGDKSEFVESDYTLQDEMILVGNLNSPVYSNNPEDYIGNYIGITDERAEKDVVDRYYSSVDQIKKYSNYDELFRALKENSINYVIVHRGIYQYYKVFRQEPGIKEVLRFYMIDMPLAGSKSDKVLIDIFNKAIETKALNIYMYINKWRSYTVDLEEVIMAKNLIIQEELDRQKRILVYMFLLSLSLIISTAIIINLYKKAKKSNELLYRQMHFEPDMDIPNKRTFLENRKKIKLREYDTVVCIAVANQLEINQLYAFKEGEEIRIKIADMLKKLESTEFIENLYYVNGIYALIMRNRSIEDIPENIRLLKESIKNSSGKKVKLRISYSINEEEESNFEKNFERAYFLVNSSDKSAVVEATTKKIDDEKELLFLATDLPRAISNNEIVPYFQPKISCKTGEINGVEALARWIHPEKGIIPPYKFIPRAEENGNIIGIDLAIAESAIARLKQWELKNIIKEDFILSFNLSPKTLMLQDIAEKVASLLNKYRVSTKNIEIEVTETVVINNYEHFENIISKFRDMGILVAIDDFSAGNASLDYIIKIDFTTLKIDRSLLTGVTLDNKKKLQVYKAVVDIGKKLNMKLVAEGVETKVEEELIKSFGVDEIQGYYYAKPLKERDFIIFLHSF